MRTGVSPVSSNGHLCLRTEALLIGARPPLRLTNQATQRAALEIECLRIHERDRTTVSVAIFGVVDLAFPLVGGRVRLHVDDDLDADQWPHAFCRVGIVFVCLRLACVRIVRFLQGDDLSTQSAAAVDDGDRGPAVFRQPVSVQITGPRGCHGREAEDGRCSAYKNPTHKLLLSPI